MPLIHDKAAFSKESILSNASKFGFPNPLAVELFLWDLELAAQLQVSSGNIIMKGGAATQLFLPVERQRGSLDVDLITSLDSDSLARIITATEARMEQVRFEPYTPKKPKPGLNARTYYAHTNSATQPEPLRVKLDFMLYDLGLPNKELSGIQTFAAKTSKLKCLTADVLVGDKILTLAKNSIGLKGLADYPKQIYDLSMLIDSSEFHSFEDVALAIRKITPVEAKIANCETDHISALDDVVSFIDGEMGAVDTSKASGEMKSKIQAFEQFFAPAGQRTNLEGWSSRALRIRFVAKLAQRLLGETLRAQDCKELLDRARSVEFKLNGARGSEVARLRNALMLFQKGYLPYFNELRGKSLRRVSWQVLSQDNIEQIEKVF